MPYVKLFRMFEYYDDYESNRILTNAVSTDDWEEITKEELEILRKYLHRVHDGNITIIEKIENGAIDAMPKIQEMIASEVKAKEEAKAKAKQKAANAALKKLKKTKEAERQLWISLQEKYSHESQ